MPVSIPRVPYVLSVKSLVELSNEVLSTKTGLSIGAAA